MNRFELELLREEREGGEVVFTSFTALEMRMRLWSWRDCNGFFLVDIAAREVLVVEEWRLGWMLGKGMRFQLKRGSLLELLELLKFSRDFEKLLNSEHCLTRLIK
jgi:hypothetical protein